MIRYKGLNKITDIEIITDDKTYDLHNAGEFTGFDYNMASKSATFTWDYFDNDTSKVFATLVLTIKEIEGYEYWPFNEELNNEEHKCLDSIQVDHNSNTISILFKSEQKFEIMCKEIEFNLKDQNENPPYFKTCEI
jgi:hypothetical protein